MNSKRAVIVGTGIAGVSAAAGMRAAGFEGEILLVGEEPELPYRRPPVSKEVVRGDKTADDIRIKPEAWYGDLSIELVTGVRVTALDPAAGRVSLDTGRTVSYDRLLLATGGAARMIGDPDAVFTLRRLADVPALHDRLTSGGHVIIVGAGLIGSEVAASARTLGCDVTLLETASLPLPRLLPPILGQMYVELHKGNGTDLHTDVTVASISRDGEETLVRAVDGRTWSAPTVVVAIGMTPATDLASRAGLAVENGIVVDASGETSAPGIYAAGDVANLPSGLFGGRHRIEHWQHAQHHGTAVGHAMAGADSTFDEVPWCWSDQYGANLQVTGWPDAHHDVHIRGSVDRQDFSAFFVDGDRLVGAVALRRPADIRTARKLISYRARLNAVLLADESVDVADSVA